jgi:formylglycine-generating enzyme required for sulfatase activity
MHRLLGLPLALVVVTGLTAVAPEKFDPFPRKEEILKTFADEFVMLTPGQGKYAASFVMGSKTSAAEEPAHRVTFAHAFAMGKYEVTQELYQVVVGTNPAKWKGPRNSVEMISWQEANDFCVRVTKLLRAAKSIGDDETIRLPSEAEWEYACRAGTETAWSFGDDVAQLTHYAWFKENSKGHDPPVGMKKSNPWGFYDMHGYNWEWCADDWAPDYQGAPADGRARRVDGATEKVIRGGAWPTAANTTRSAYRQHVPAERRDDTIGFRCVKAKS